MKKDSIASFLSLAFLIATLMAQNAARADLPLGQSLRLQMNYSGETRTYVLHVPAKLKSGTNAPLMLALHPFNATGEGMERLSQFDLVSDENGFFVAYPDSSVNANPPRSWSINGAGADVGFSVALLQEIQAKYPIDPKHIYVSGFSMGGGLTQRLACDHADLFAGVGVVSVNFNPESLPTCHPSRPLKIVYFHGTDDPIIPYNGGMSNGPAGPPHLVYSALETAKAWVNFNGCKKKEDKTLIADILLNNAEAPTKSSPTVDTFELWTGCNDGVTVGFYTIQGGGHTIPGGKCNDKWGQTSEKLHAASIIWKTLKDSTEHGVDLRGPFQWLKIAKKAVVPYHSTPLLLGVPYCGSESPVHCSVESSTCYVQAGVLERPQSRTLEFTQYRCQ